MSDICADGPHTNAITWSPTWNTWLCPICRHLRTETLLNTPHAVLPIHPADLTPTSDRPHP